ncbi:MAG: hypothetical protein IJX63_00095 [Lachnospiraceae bacterium]|nr:hypothetical protein [Lachnospiraceae bacterium]
MLETRYDFSKWMDAMDKLSLEKLQPYMDFFDSLPYHKALEIESVWGKKVIFRIVHSFYESEEVSEEIYAYTVGARFQQFAENVTETDYQRQRAQRYAADYLQHDGKYRKEMLKKLGHPAYLNMPDEDAEHVAREPRYSEGQQVVFWCNGQKLTGTFALCKGIAETDIVESL